MQEKFLNQARVAELWAAIKAALAGKADLSALGDYATPETVAEAITAALTDYAKNSEVTAAITTALADYITKTQMDEAIQKAVASAAGITVQVLEALPETGEEKVLYLAPSDTEGTMDQYLWTDGAFKKVGNTSVALDQYWSKDELAAMTAAELAAILV